MLVITGFILYVYRSGREGLGKLCLILHHFECCLFQFLL